MIAKRNNEQLWQQVKRDIQGNRKWNARLAQQAVLEYKKRGGTYSNTTPKNKTSLNKWTKEQWQYVSKDSKRYLPKRVIDSLTAAEKIEASVSKKRFGKNYKYPSSVNRKMKLNKIY